MCKTRAKELIRETVFTSLATIADLVVGAIFLNATNLLTFQFQVCHSRFDRNLSSNGHCRSRRCLGMQEIHPSLFMLVVENHPDLSLALVVVHR